MLVHPVPFQGQLVFTAGALLANAHGSIPADWPEVVNHDGDISLEGLLGLYRRRLVPVFSHINAFAAEERSALITVPGLGCGLFAGPFRGALGPMLEQVLKRILQEYGQQWSNIRAIHFDPYSQCGNTREIINGKLLQVRPSKVSGNQPIPQLCRPETYATAEDDFTACNLYSLVAWDHVSWPGHDFYIGSLCNDDGVKAAATDAMATITGVSGSYDVQHTEYRPPAPYRDWNAVVPDRIEHHGLKLWSPTSVIVT
jgi:hypothetical protein